MSEWWTYRPSDFLLFSPRVYERLIASHNSSLWPWQILALALGALVIVLVLNGGTAGRRVALGLLGAAAIVAGWSFLWARYANINWVAGYAAPAFALNGAAMGLAAVLSRPSVAPAGASAVPGIAALVTSLALYPAATAILGGVSAAEIAGVTADPTALAMLAALALWPNRPVALALSIVPLLWCAYAAMTLFTLGAPSAWLMTAGLAFGLAASLRLRPA